MSAEEERVREVFGKPRGRAGKPEQDSDRGAEGAQGHLLPQDGVKTRRKHAKNTPHGNFYSPKQLQDLHCHETEPPHPQTLQISTQNGQKTTKNLNISSQK